jgi:hypothetical protein
MGNGLTESEGIYMILHSKGDPPGETKALRNDVEHQVDNFQNVENYKHCQSPTGMGANRRY